MRTTIAWLAAAAVVVIAVLAACRARENFAADSATGDSATGDSATGDTTRADETATDTAPSKDSIRAMHPAQSEVTAPKRPRTWRGLKLPEEIPVRPPIEPMRRIERVPDSVVKEDSTRPPTPEADG